MADSGRRIRSSDPYVLTLESAVSAKTVIQLPDGYAGITQTSGQIGDSIPVATVGVYPIAKTTGIVFLPGTKIFWDHSANSATYKRAGDRDFYVGTCVGGAASADTEVSVDLNKMPRIDINLATSGYDSVPVGTAAAGGFGYPVDLGGSLKFELTATSEAQKVDALSVDSFSGSANAIAEFVVRVPTDGASGSQDISIGLANDTHATDADSITESIFFHLDGNSTTIRAESDDGTHEVAATDTTKTYTEGSAITNRKEFWIDFRNPSSVALYVDAVQVLSATTFNVSSATGPWKMLVHVEKSSGTDVYVLRVDSATVRFSEQ